MQKLSKEVAYSQAITRGILNSCSRANARLQTRPDSASALAISRVKRTACGDLLSFK